MDSDSPISRVERTFWTVWYYISGAVSRFLRPEPANVTTSDPNSIQESAIDSEHANVGDAGRGGVGEEQPLTTASLLNSSRPLVAWELCSTDIDLGPDGESVQYKASEEGEGTREEQDAQAGHGDAGMLVAKEDKQEENGDQQLNTGERDEVSENGVYDAMTEDMEESGRKADAQEEAEMAMTPEDPQKMGEIKAADDKVQHGNEEDLKIKDTLVKLEEEDNIHIEEAKVQRKEADTAVMHEKVENLDGVPQLASEEGAKRVENQLSVCEELSDDDRYVKGFTSLHVKSHMFDDKSVIVSEGELIVVEQGHVMAHRSESDEAEDEKEEEEEEEDESDQTEEANNQTSDDDNVKTEESQELVTCSEEVVQNAKAELDVGKDTEVQTKTRETDDDETESHREVIDEESDVTAMHISVDERFFDEDRVEEERLSEVGSKESYMKVACTTTSVTVKPEGETGQEMSGGFKNIPLGICEGRVVVSQGLNFPTYEETQEGVPEHNNESGPDENTTQRILEGDGEEIQGSQLPEEVESKEPESLQNSGRSTKADYLPLREHMEEEQEGTQDIKNSVDAGVRQETEKQLVEAVIQESGDLFEEEEGELLVDSVRTGIEHSEKEFESNVYLSDETDEATQETEDETEELLVEFEIDERLCDSTVDDAAGDSSETTGDVTAEEVIGFADETEAQKMTETSFFQESLGAINSEQNVNMTASLLEDIAESGFCKPSDETVLRLLEDVQMQDAGIDMEEAAYGVEEAAGVALQIKIEMEILHLAESEFPPQVASPEAENQRSDEARETSDEEMLTDPEAADESTTDEPKDLTWISTEEVAKHVTESEGSCAEETVHSISGRPDVINDEILDLWIQAALSEDTSGIKQHEGLEPTKEEQDEVSSVQTKMDKKQLGESNSGESELVSDTEMSSSTVESGFLDQSLSDWGTQNSETQLLKSTSTGSFQGIYDMLANMSESVDISELSTQPDTESQAILMEEEAETEQSHLKQEEFYPLVTLKLQEKTEEERVESVETETGSQKETDAEVTAWKDTEEADVKSLTGLSVLLKVEKTNALSDSQDEIKRTASESTRSGSEASLEEEIVFTESGSQGDTCSESERKLPSVDEPEPGWSEDIAESLAGLNRDEVADEPMFDDQMEVDTSVLDSSAQRSRIAVKNPRVRPPKDPRSLLHMPSVDPTPSPHLSAKLPAGVPLGGLGIGIKLPGLGAGFPVLKKTQQGMREETSMDNLSQETKPEEKSDTPKQDEAQHKPKWMPPRHPGFGNPLMSELKTKLKKTTKE